MTLDLFKERGVPLDRQSFDWRDLVRAPYSKLDDDAFTRVRVILMSGIEAEAVRFQHYAARMNDELRPVFAAIRRVEHHQQTLVNMLNPPDQSPLETTLGFEQAAIEVTASLAIAEPDLDLARVYRFGLLEDLDHLYRFAALYDRLEGRDANALIQSYTDILPGRPTMLEHRAPIDDLRKPYDRRTAALISKLHASTITAAEHQLHDFLQVIGPMFADPVARQLYAEIASIKEQHLTQYESLADANETWLEKWLIHEATEVYNYYSCAESETNPRIKPIWEMFTDYELGHFQVVRGLLEDIERRDATEIIEGALPAAIRYESHRDFVRSVLRDDVELTARGTEFVSADEVSADSPSAIYRRRMNDRGSPSEVVARSFIWTPGGEILREISGRAT